jgi:hypothetical protein
MMITLLIVVLAMEPVFVYVMLRKACLDVFSSESTIGTQSRETTIIYTLREDCAPAGGPRSR